VVVLEGLVPDRGTLLGGEFQTLSFWLLGGVFHGRLVVLEEGFVLMGAFAVGSTVRKHLKNAKVEADLDTSFPVISEELANVGLSGNEGPSCKEGREVVRDSFCLFFVRFF
jgi:hypothetical protein